jgi:glycolate oxidase FAD binding subunit
VWRVGLRPQDVASFLERLDQAPFLNQPSASMWQAGVGDGRIRVVDRLQLADNDAEQFQKRSVGRIEELRAIAESFGGALVIEQAPAEIKARANAWGRFGSSAGLMQRVKQELDPDGILSPGRFEF